MKYGYTIKDKDSDTILMRGHGFVSEEDAEEQARMEVSVKGVRNIRILTYQVNISVQSNHQS